jgi:hypothetical protein
VSVTAIVDAGRRYIIRRIEFRGNHVIADSALRRAMKIDEGDVLDARKLEVSVARLGRFSMFEPLSEQDILVTRRPASNSADILINVREKKAGRWAFSGPALPARFAGPFQAAISTRLPAWGGGVFETSTYFASLSLTGLAGPLSRALGLTTLKWLPLVSLQRPLLPGQDWMSGFTLSPQLSWKYSLASYAGSQLQAHMPGAAGESSPLVIPVEHGSRPGYLICEEKRSRWRKAVEVVPKAASLLLSLR